MIRPYRDSDRAELVALWHLGGLTRAWNDPDRDIDRKVAQDPGHLLVLEVDDRLVGSVMVGYEGHRGWINYLVVHPDHRGRGLGRALVHEAERRLGALGCPKVNLQVRSSNRAGHRLLSTDRLLGRRRGEHGSPTRASGPAPTDR